ncbi:MAG: DUF456 domain-containing protein [Bacteroides sp.]|nr:DUF456 domain-containing protein [Bacteroides sp.]
MDILLMILCGVCLLLGLVGCLLPILPGPPFAYIGMVFLYFTTPPPFTVWQLTGWLALVVLVQIVDYFIPIWGARRLGGSSWAVRGSIAGTIAGLFVFPPWGLLLGPLVGATAGELLGGRGLKHSIRAGLGVFVGFIAGTVCKFMLCGWFIYLYLQTIFGNL